MKIAVISDIHGNYEALVAVLSKAKKEKVEHLLILGDLVGYYYHPDKVLKLISEWSFDLIKGNHEKILENLMINPSLEESIRLKYGSGHQIAIDKLTSKQILYLKSLPDKKDVKFEKTSLLMCHGSPWSNDFYIYPDCDYETIKKCDSTEHDFVLIGHSHYQFAVKNQNAILINPGSVGQSRQIGGRASWCIINTLNKCFQFMNTDYCIDSLVFEVSKKDKDVKYLTEVLKRK